jgi:glycosyltransferase involved in cell wall biosynthesis
MSTEAVAESPLVSILTPSFNQGQWLSDTIRSVKSQTYSRVEHIVMDGGSSDSTVELLETSAGVIWRSEKDEGQSHALNKALGLAEGEIIGWLNSDDAYFDRRVIEDVVNAFASNLDVSVIYGHAALANPVGRVLQILWAPRFNYRLLRLYNYIVQPTVFVRTRAINEMFADQSYEYMMDKELWLRLGLTERFLRLPRIIAIDRHHPARKSLTRPDLARADLARLVHTYGVPTGFGVVAMTKLLKIVFRTLGALKLQEATRADLAFDGSFDSPLRFAARQLGARRKRMPLGQVGYVKESGTGWVAK